MKTKNNTIILVGGGTGGHAAPILAIYQRLKKTNKNLDITVFGVGTAEERYFFDKIPDYKIICAGKMNRYATWRNLVELLKAIIGFFQALYYIGLIRPKIIFSKGGYVSLPMINAARLLGVPYFFHESDIEMGKVNVMMAKGAKKIFAAYPPESYKNLEIQKFYWCGPILREGFATKRVPNRELFSFDNKPIIFVTGGSQGSLHVSEKFLDAAEELIAQYNIIQQTGKFGAEIAEKFYNSLGDEKRSSYFFKDFLEIENGRDMMLEASAASDVVIARAGSTIVELAVMGKKMVLIPWQHAAQDHQAKNAAYFARNNSAIVISDEKLCAETITKAIRSVSSGDLGKIISENAINLFPTDGLETVCDSIINEIEEI